MTQASCRRRHNGQLAGHRGSCCQYARQEIWHSGREEGLREVFVIKTFCVDADYRGTFIAEV